jgi:hypothetical protein
MRSETSPTIIYVQGDFNKNLFDQGIRLLNEAIDELSLEGKGGNEIDSSTVTKKLPEMGPAKTAC